MAGRIRSNDPEGVRRRILDTAFEAFQAGGYYATSVQDLLRLSGLSARPRRPARTRGAGRRDDMDRARAWGRERA